MMEQFSFSRKDGYATDADAKKARDKAYYEVIKKHRRAKRWVLRNQLIKYSGFGQPDGRIMNVYMLNVYGE